jgi:hypothetical protein
MHNWIKVKEGRLADTWVCENCDYVIVYAVEPEASKRVWVEHDGYKQIQETSYGCEELQLLRVHSD